MNCKCQKSTLTCGKCLAERSSSRRYEATYKSEVARLSPVHDCQVLVRCLAHTEAARVAHAMSRLVLLRGF